MTREVGDPSPAIAFRRATMGLVSDLQRAGFTDVTSLRDLETCGDARAVPHLVALPRIHYINARREILFLLGSKWAGPEVVPVLLSMFAREFADGDPVDGARWVAGQSLCKKAGLLWLDDLIRIAEDTSHGSSRGFIVLTLGRFERARDRTVPILMRLLDEIDVEAFAIEALGNLHAEEAEVDIRLRTAHASPSMRSTARVALQKIERRRLRREG